MIDSNNIFENANPISTTFTGVIPYQGGLLFIHYLSIFCHDIYYYNHPKVWKATTREDSRYKGDLVAVKIQKRSLSNDNKNTITSGIKELALIGY